MAGSSPRLRELISRCISDDAFAQEFLANPSAAAAEYNLTANHVATVRTLVDQGLFSQEVEPHSGTPAYY